MASGPSSPSVGPRLPSVLKCAACRNTLQNVQPPKEDVDSGTKRGGKDLIPVVEEDSMPIPRWIQEKIDEVCDWMEEDNNNQTYFILSFISLLTR